MEKNHHHYVYFSYEEWGRGYIGSRSCRCLPEEDTQYFGSFRDKTFRPKEKIILQTFETREDALQAEIVLHVFYNVDINPHFANRAKQTSTSFFFSLSGQKLTEEWKENIGKAHRGRIFSEEHRKKLKESNLGKPGMVGENHPMYGRSHSEETKEKMRMYRVGKKPCLGHKHSEETKQKLSENSRGKKWYNNGKQQTLRMEAPEGFVPGRLKLHVPA